MKFLIFALNLIFLLAAASSSVAAQQSNNDSLHCGAVVNGLRLCAESLDIAVSSPQSVSLRLWIENTSENELSIQQGNFFKYLYEVEIIDQKGQKLPSFYEIAEEKQKNGTISSEESSKLLRLCCFGSLPSQQLIASREKRLLNVDLSDVYKFNSKTVYIVELKRVEQDSEGKNRFVIPLPKLKIHISEKKRGSEVKG